MEKEGVVRMCDLAETSPEGGGMREGVIEFGAGAGPLGTFVLYDVIMDSALEEAVVPEGFDIASEEVVSEKLTGAGDKREVVRGKGCAGMMGGRGRDSGGGCGLDC